MIKHFQMIAKYCFKKTREVFTCERISLLLIGLGFILRLNHYFDNRSLWLDEACAALNIAHASYSEILNAKGLLDDFAFPPMGFVLVTKVLTQILGVSEYVWRLFPLICGLISVILFYKLLRKNMGHTAMLIALAFFAVLDPLIYYSSEFKHYSIDVMITLLILVLFQDLHKRELSIRCRISYGLFGAIVMWFSYGSLFVLAAIAASMFFLCLVRRQKEQILQLSIIFSAWVWSYFFLDYKVLYPLTFNNYLQGMWQHAFMPWPIWSIECFTWLKHSLSNVFQEAVGLAFPWPAICLFILGFILFFKRQKDKAIIFILPFLLTLLLAGLHIYPFRGRLLLFAVPMILIFIAEGIAFFITSNRKYYVVIGIALTGLLFFHPLSRAGHYLLQPRLQEEMRPVMRYFKEQKREGDSFYLNNSAQEAYFYYLSYHNFRIKDQSVWVLMDRVFVNNAGEFVEVFYTDYLFNKNGRFITARRVGRSEKIYKDDVNKLGKNKRTWILFSHVKDETKKFFLAYLDTIGIKLDEFIGVGCALYLYDLSQQKSPALLSPNKDLPDRLIFSQKRKG